MVRMQTQTVDAVEGTEHNRQKQLCVPFVTTEGESYRMREAKTQGGRRSARA